MDEFARRQPDERSAFFAEAASRLDLTTAIIEKDFWVCWILRRLMEIKTLDGHFTFKGGTSLSKAYNIIHRFSEDVDLTINRKAPLICNVNSPLEEGISGKERERRITALEQAARYVNHLACSKFLLSHRFLRKTGSHFSARCSKGAAQRYVGTIVMPALISKIEAALETSDGWELLIDPEDRDAQTVLFNYPKLTGHGGDTSENTYIKPRIKLEFGARGDPEPYEIKSISPYLAEVFPDIIVDAICKVPTLAMIRTFWEKVTILHALHHNSKLRDGMSRHYNDALMLTRSGIASEAKDNARLLEQVVRNKKLMFADNSASYKESYSGIPAPHSNASDQNKTQTGLC